MVSRRRIRAGAGVLVCFALLLLTGCGNGNGQSTLDPQSSPSRDISNLWWGMLVAAAIVFAGTLVLIFLSRARRDREGFPFLGTDEKKLDSLVVVFGIVVPVLALTALFYIADIGVLRATDAPAKSQTRMTIKVIARQWFWEVRYPGSQAVTANEIHIPVRTPVKVVVTSADVIHSFWVPELNKKVDAVPGHPNSLYLFADKVGSYRGQCAEFCGLQHAKMALRVDADPPDRFRAWLANESKPLAASAQQPGFQAFTNSQCASCHTLRGTSAQGRIGPDLTHLMSRKTLGALTIPNTRGYLGAWIVDPQQFKPGNRMPGLKIHGQQMTELLNFLEGLK